MLYLTLLALVLIAWTPATWGVALAPLGVSLIVVVRERSRFSGLGRDNVWRMLGASWGRVGWCLLLVAIAAYSLDVAVGYKMPDYNQSFYERLRQRTSAMSRSTVRQQLVREAASRIDEQELRDIANSLAGTLAPDHRNSFLNSFLASKFDPGIIQWGDLLAKPSEKSGGIENFATTTTLPLDERQRKLHASGKWNEFWPSLRNDQWRYIYKQMLVLQAKEALGDVLASLAGELDEVEGRRLTRELLDTRYPGDRWRAMRLAKEAGAPQLQWLFEIIVDGISWLRGLPWLLLWVILGVVVILQAHRMETSTRLFAVNRQ